jgi:hypothetical protein
VVAASLAAISPLTQSRSERPEPHVVVLVLDELPLTSLLDAHRRIDQVRYPNFAALARESTWYRNTTSVHADTQHAVPAILDARRPHPHELSVARAHPLTLFALLAGRYRLHVHEEATQLCPARYCARHGPLEVRGRPSSARRNARLIVRAGRTALIGARARRRLVLSHLGLSRPDRFRQWVSEIGRTRTPQLDFFHLLMPHLPVQFMPSGRNYKLPTGDEVRGLLGERSFDDPWLVREDWQRHLLQLGAVDRLIGELVAQLKRKGIWDQSIVVVTADHGMSFRRHQNRRALRDFNVGELAPVPLFVKGPGQERGAVSDSARETIDVVPTIADLLGVRIPWRVDGRSARRPAPRRTRRMLATDFSSFAVDAARYRGQRKAVLARKTGLFGWGLHRPGLFGIGPHGNLPGKHLSSFRVVRSHGARLRVRGEAAYRFVRPESGFVPTHVQGAIEHGRAGGGRPLAFAVNGTIFVTSYSFSLRGSNTEYVSAMLPEEVLRPGRNRLQVFEIGRRGVLIKLADLL